MPSLVLGSIEVPLSCGVQGRVWSNGGGKVMATATLPDSRPTTWATRRQIHQVHQRQKIHDVKRRTGRSPPRKNAPEIMPSQPRQDNEQSDSRQYHTANLKHKGRGWREKIRSWNKTAKQEASQQKDDPKLRPNQKWEPNTNVQDVSAQRATTYEPEVRSNNCHTRQSRPASSSVHSTDKGRPIWDKRQNKRHHAIRNNGRTRSGHWRRPYKKDQQIHKTTDTQRWIGCHQGCNIKT